MAKAEVVLGAAKFQTRTVRSQLALCALLLSLPTVLSTIGLLVWLYHAQKSAATQQLAFTVNAISLVVDDQINQARTRLEALSASDALLRGDFTAFEREARASISLPNGWISFRPLNGDLLFTTRLEPGLPPPNCAILSDIYAGVRAGHVVVSAQWPDGQAAGRRLAVAMLAAPLNGEQYVVSQAVPAAGMTALLLSQSLPGTWTAVILDKDLRIFARSRGPADLLGQTASPDLAAAIGAVPKGTMDSVTMEKTTATMVWSRSPETGLTTVIAIPRSEIATASLFSTMAAGVIGMAIILASVAISRRFAWGIIGPIDALIAMAQALGGRCPVAAVHTGLRETDLVANAILAASAVLLDQDSRLREKAAALAHVEHAEHEVEARFRFATQAGRLGVWELDLQTKALIASTTAKEIFGHDPAAAFTFQDMRDSIHPDDLDRVTAALDHSFASGADYDVEYRIIRPDGKAGWLKARAQVIRAVDGTASGLAGVSLEITERVLTGERIRQSQRVEAVGRLTAGVAHDFNNLLQGLLGGIELAIDQAGDRPDIRANLELTLQAGQRGARLTSHLLSFARQQVLRPTALELAPLLTELSNTLARTLGRDIAVNIDVASDLPPVLADAAYLDSALLNVALNARDAMPGGGDLRISAYPMHEQVVIEVEDTGEGMAADVLAQACEPFFSTKGTKGSGLGLSMVQGFARQSGGELRIASVPGQGTRIEIALPIATRAAVPAARPKPQQIRGHGRVLVVDDDADVARITTAFLEDAGFDVTTAKGGDEALIKMSIDPSFDALVTDYAMPGMNGADLILHARKLCPALSALIITGYAGAEGQDHLPSNVVILRKPFRRDELLRRVKSLIDSGPQPGTQHPFAVGW